MSINILGGHAKGHALFIPKLNTTRPTSVMLRRKFFDANQDCSEIIFVDLFAGSGAMGLEALSRGAKKVYLCEKDKFAFKALRENIQSIRSKIPDGNIESVCEDATKWLQYFLKSYSVWSSEDKENTYLFIDPPYELKSLYSKVSEILISLNFIGSIWIESDRQKGIKLEEFSELDLVVDKIFKQGTSFICKVSKK